LALTGVVTAQREAVLRLVVLGTGGRQAEIEAILDTGFTGHLTLPRTVIDELAPRWQGVREAVLADGRRVALETFRARVIWDGATREVQVLASQGSDAPVGMALLWGYEVRLRGEEGGAVVIERLPRGRP
jgi:clan AA aspartic protease